jgi:oligopeptide transport system substrate-binding protein
MSSRLPARLARQSFNPVNVLRAFASLGLLLGVVALLGCSRRDTLVARGDREGVLHVGNGAEIQSLDPHLAGGAVDHNVLSALFEGLVTFDEETLEPRPGAAERWTVSPNGLVYTFHLRPGAKWSNGDPLTARDFLYSFRRALSPSLGSEYKESLYPIVNAEDFAKGRIANFSVVGIRAHEDTLLEITLAQPTPHFLSVLRTNVTFPVHAASVERDGAAPTDRTAKWTRAAPFVSNGPFKLREWKDHQHVVVEKNPHYWDAPKVRLNAVHFYPSESTQAQELAFRAGQLHTTWDVPLSKLDSYRKDAPAVLRIEPYLESYFLRFNNRHPVLSDVRVRAALSLAIDRETIVRNLLRGGQTAATSLTPPGFTGYTPPVLVKHDPATAKQLLAAAGFPEGRGFPKLELTTISSEINQRIAEAIQQMWRRDLGVEIQIAQKEFKVLLDAFDTLDYAIARGRWIAEFADPLTHLNIFSSTNGVNGTGFADARYDALLAAANRERNPAARFSELQRAEAYLMAQMPIAPIYWGSRTTLVAPSVRGWKKSPLGFRNYKDIWLEP